MKEVMSTTIRDFKDVAREFMDGQKISMMVVLSNNETGEIKIHGAWDWTTEREDCLIEVEDDYVEPESKYVDIEVIVVDDDEE